MLSLPCHFPKISSYNISATNSYYTLSLPGHYFYTPLPTKYPQVLPSSPFPSDLATPTMHLTRTIILQSLITLLALCLSTSEIFYILSFSFLLSHCFQFLFFGVLGVVERLKIRLIVSFSTCLVSCNNNSDNKESNNVPLKMSSSNIIQPISVRQYRLDNMPRSCWSAFTW